MKTTLMLFAVALALLVTTAASAQTIQVKTDIPFSFIINGATLPAGEYLVRSQGVGGALVISDLNSHRNNLILTNACSSLKVATKTKLVFHRYGDRYFLNQIWIAGNDSGRELPTSAREKEVARDFSKEEVLLVAAQR
jgi:hypothetical protein